MSASIQIELVDSDAGTFTFDVDGEFSASQEMDFQEGADPPVLERIVETWQINNARIVAADSEAVFVKWLAFQAKIESRDGTRYTGARIIRDGVTEKVLGGSSTQQFRVESAAAHTDDEVPNASFQTVIAVTMTLVAVQNFNSGIAANNISGFKQTVSNSWRNGLHTLEWRTTVKTQEGTDARESAKVVGKIPIDLWGNTYTWDTNGPDGVDYDYEDADESTSSLTPNHIPTEVTVVSRIRQWGISIGTPTSGNAINGTILKETETRIENGVKTTTVRAAASGPGCKIWVEQQKPSVGDITTAVISHDEADRNCIGEWIIEGDTDDPNDPKKLTYKISLVVSGGGQEIAYVAMSGIERPKKVVGSFKPYRLIVTFNAELTGEVVGRHSMRLPVAPGEPWVFLQNASHEDPIPRLIEKGPENVNKWSRGAVLVFESPMEFDPLSLFRVTHSEPNVDSYMAKEIL